MPHLELESMDYLYKKSRYVVSPPGKATLETRNKNQISINIEREI